MVEAVNRKRVWVPMALLGVAVASVIAVKILADPLDDWLWLGAVFVAIGVYGLALVCGAMAIAAARRFGSWRDAVLVAIVAVMAAVAVTPLDLTVVYPWAYFQVHRQQFVALSELTDDLAMGTAERREVHLPAHVGLGEGTLDAVQPDPPPHASTL